MERPYQLGAVILAAGKSSRMGRPKLLLPWAGTSVLGHLFQQWRGLGVRQVTVVCAVGDEAIGQEAQRLGFSKANLIHNPSPERGMFCSIQCAARWTGWQEGLTHWAIMLGDQPLVRDDTLRALLAFSAARPGMICQPMQGGHPRHPVVLPRAAFLALADAAGPTLKAFLQGRAAELAFCAADDPGLALDLDRPEDYARALELAKKGAIKSGG